MKWFKHNLAALLSSYRLAAGFTAGVLAAIIHWVPEVLGFNTHWVVLVLVITAVLTEPIDGRIALTPGWEPQSYWFGGDGQSMNAHAGTGIFGVLPFGILVNLVVDWWYRGHVFTVTQLRASVVWALVCFFFVVMTKKYEKAKAEHRGQVAENYEVSQAWFAGLIVVACAFAIRQIGKLDAVWFGVLLVSTIIAVCYLGRKRLFERELERNNGNYD